MGKTLSALVLSSMLGACLGATDDSGGLVLVEGGVSRNTTSRWHGRGVAVASFYLGKYEVTQREWTEVMGSNPSVFKGDTRPVDTVSWYDCVEYCNRRSTKEGLQPCYVIDRSKRDAANPNPNDDLKWTVTLQTGANGYRLPTEAEWEYAAGGGRLSKSFPYSGGDDLDRVAWFWQNAGDRPLGGLWTWPAVEQNHNRTHPVGEKTPNELGLYDLSGNVREWCWDWLENPRSLGPTPQDDAPTGLRIWKGGGWLGGDFCCAIAFRGGFEANGKGADQGFRVCRSR